MARAARRVEDAATEEAPENQALDEASQEGQSPRTGQVGEADDDFVKALARRAGHTPKEEWTRDPAKWVDERTYLERLPDEVKALQERNRRTAQAAAEAIEDSRRQARIEAQAEVRAAAEAADPDRADRAAQRLAEVSGPPPAVAAFIARNEWFESDPAARAVAAAVTERLSRQGASVERQLEEAEAEVKRRFPEHFGQVERQEPRTEVKLSETRRVVPPVVNEGTRGADTRVKEKGFADIPQGDRALYAKHFAKRFESSGLKPEDAQAKYARSYWANKDG